MGVDWQKLLLAAGGTAAAGLALYFLLHEECEASKQMHGSFDEAESEEEKCIEILTEMAQVQAYNKKIAEGMAAEWVQTPLGFVDLMKKVAMDMMPDDVLQKRGLDMSDVEKMLEKHQDNDTVRMLVMRFMGANFTPPSDAARKVTVETLKDIHRLMVKELEQFFNEYKSRPDAKDYDPQKVLVASQVVLSGKVRAKFNLTAEDVEGAIQAKSGELQTDREFLELTQKMQELLQSSIPMS